MQSHTQRQPQPVTGRDRDRDRDWLLDSVTESNQRAECCLRSDVPLLSNCMTVCPGPGADAAVAAAAGADAAAVCSMQYAAYVVIVLAFATFHSFPFLVPRPIVCLSSLLLSFSESESESDFQSRSQDRLTNQNKQG